jgi:hypothetical protein
MEELEGPAHNQLSRTGRRFLAKAVDIVLFGVLSLAVGRLFLPEQWSQEGVVPAFGTTVWALGFYVVADTICAQLFDATPGEFLAGIRVRMMDGSKLTWTARQDRTTDALVVGTIGVFSLLRGLLSGNQAPYDRDWTVQYLGTNALQRFAVGAAIAALLLCVVAAGFWMTAMKVDPDFELSTRKLMSRLGFPVREIWLNPVTGARLVLPGTCSVRHRPTSTSCIQRLARQVA